MKFENLQTCAGDAADSAAGLEFCELCKVGERGRRLAADIAADDDADNYSELVELQKDLAKHSFCKTASIPLERQPLTAFLVKPQVTIGTNHPDKCATWGKC